MASTGIHAVLRMLSDAGVRYLFGNPGTTELPLNDALLDQDSIRYILGLQEVPVMAMADGYAMASGKIAVVNLHVSCGLGNAMGMLYNAFREGTPLLVTAGQQDRRLIFEEPILASDLVRVARPWTKWAAEVNRVQDLPSAVRRAIQTALTPPTGPVFLSIPVDVQMEAADGLDLTPPRLVNSRVRPPVEAVRMAAEALLSAANPAILAGSRVTERDAVEELVAVAEVIGAPVISESGTTHGRLVFPCDHPLYGQGLPLWSPEVRERLKDHDVLLVVGMDLLRQYLHYEPRAIPEGTRLVHFDEDAYQIGKNYPVEVGVLGDTKVGLGELAELLRRTASPSQKEQFRQRAKLWSQTHREAKLALVAKMRDSMDARPLSPLALMGTLADVIPPDVAVVEEAVTTTNTTLERLGALKNTSGYFGHRGWALGWGLGCAIGVKLAWPDRPVMAILGEGAAMYGIQGLWSAARNRIPVTFVICNNSQYKILKVGAAGLNLPSAKSGRFEGLDITDPEIDFVALARSLGVEAKRVSEPDELAATVRAALEADSPTLIDVPIERGTPARLEYG
jgi:benzoylformate decarboxylase